MIEAIDKGKPIRTEYPYALQAFALGDSLTLLALSGEVVVDCAFRLERELGGDGKALWVAAYANDVVGYIPSVRVLKEGGTKPEKPFTTEPGPRLWPKISSRSLSRRHMTWWNRCGKVRASAQGEGVSIWRAERPKLLLPERRKATRVHFS
jgi:hypothetical protein